MLSIHKLRQEFKHKLSSGIPFDFFIALLITLISFSAFTLGWIARSQYQTEPISVEKINLTNEAGKGVFVGSVNSDVYHYRWCSGASRINADNKIYFSSKSEAEESGYEPASNCPGL